MEVTKSFDQNTLTVRLKGSLDTNFSGVLLESISNEIEKADKLILDFKELTYISSAGLRSVLSLHKTMAKKDGMIVKNASAEIMFILDSTCFTDFLTFEDCEPIPDSAF